MSVLKITWKEAHLCNRIIPSPTTTLIYEVALKMLTNHWKVAVEILPFQTTITIYTLLSTGEPLTKNGCSKYIISILCPSVTQQFLDKSVWKMLMKTLHGWEHYKVPQGGHWQNKCEIYHQIWDSTEWFYSDHLESYQCLLESSSKTCRCLIPKVHRLPALTMFASFHFSSGYRKSWRYCWTSSAYCWPTQEPRLYSTDTQILFIY